MSERVAVLRQTVAIRRGALVIVGRDQKTTETVGSRLRAHYGDAFDIEGVEAPDTPQAKRAGSACHSRRQESSIRR